jgi:Protein of unknown function (DUF3054)
VRIVVGVALDTGLICLFAAIGRHNHGEPGSALGVASTAWPFLAGMTAGWLACLLACGRPPLRAVDGVTVLVGTVAIGMVLRAMTNAGTAPAFIVVATAFLGAGLLGWRAVAALPGSRRA